MFLPKQTLMLIVIAVKTFKWTMFILSQMIKDVKCQIYQLSYTWICHTETFLILQGSMSIAIDNSEYLHV